MHSETVERLRDLYERSGLKAAPARVMVAGSAACLLVIAAAAWRWGLAPGGEAVAAGTTEVTSRALIEPGPPASDEPSASVFVHVGGSVRHPGVYELTEGTRVIDAIDAAGGFMPDAFVDAINLARPIVDGEQVLVPDEDDAAPSPPVGPQNGGAAGVSAAAQVDLNSADVTQLDTLPGVGPSTAAKIVAERESNGRFGSVDDLARVPGIGPKKLDGLRDFACVR